MKAEVSIPVGLATMAVVYGVYDHMLPNQGDVAASQPQNSMVSGRERGALVASVAVAGGISLIAKDATPFILGGLFAVVLSWSMRHANAYDPVTGLVSATGVTTDGRRYMVQTAD